jgi:hypothetical protein
MESSIKKLAKKQTQIEANSTKNQIAANSIMQKNASFSEGIASMNDMANSHISSTEEYITDSSSVIQVGSYE